MSEAVVIVSYRALPEQVACAGRELASLVATVLAVETECLGIRLLQDSSEPTRYTLVERWPSQEHFLGLHMQQPHIQSFIQGAGAFLAGPPEISFWHAVGEA